MAARVDLGDRLIRWVTMISVVVLAVIAAVISYRHMYLLVCRYGENSWTAALLPVSVDGMIAAASMSLLIDSRQGRRSSALPWMLLVVGSAASLAANVAVAEPSAVGRVIAAWPSCALIGSYELLMRQVRCAAGRGALAPMHMPHASPAAHQNAPHRSPHQPVEEPGSSLSSLASTTRSDTAFEVMPAVVADAAVSADDVGAHAEAGFAEDNTERFASRSPEAGGRAHSSGRRPVSQLQRQAWQWAAAHRTLAGDLPSGKAIAERFGRGERWGRLVKTKGIAGLLGGTDTQADPLRIAER